MGLKMLKIEHRDFISCTLLETTTDNHGYICWGKIYEVAEELELLDWKHKGGRRLGAPCSKRSPRRLVFVNK